MADHQAKTNRRIRMSISLRTLMLGVGVVAAYLGVFVSASRDLGPFAFVTVISCLVFLLALVCGLFSSVADDLWGDPEMTYAAAILGFLGFAVLLSLGSLLPVTARVVDTGITP